MPYNALMSRVLNVILLVLLVAAGYALRYSYQREQVELRNASCANKTILPSGESVCVQEIVPPTISERVLGFENEFGCDQDATSMSCAAISIVQSYSAGPESSTLIALTDAGGTFFTVPAVLHTGTELTLKWKYAPGLLLWGDEASICIIGLDARKQPIPLTKNETRNCLPDRQPLLASAKLSSGEYRWMVADDIRTVFMEVPRSYRLSVRVLDASTHGIGGKWAGLLSDSTSNEFVIK